MRVNNSPWLHKFKYEREAKILTGSHYTDVCILGGGISGMSTAYMLLKHTDKKVTLIEGDLVAHGATGHNAGYVIAEFEKPFKDIVKEYGLHTAREGKREIDEAWGTFFHMREVLGMQPIHKIDGPQSFADLEYFKEILQDKYLKYGKIENKVYLDKDSSWVGEIESNYLEHIQLVDRDIIKKMVGNDGKYLDDYKAIMIEDMTVANSAIFTEELAKFCLRNFPDRFEIFEKSFVSSIRLLQDGNVILDSVSGTCLADKVVLCTNGFENFDIFGPLNSEIDKSFHHEVSGLIGYMMASFIKTDTPINRGGIFYGKGYGGIKVPFQSGGYTYYTTRKYDYDIRSGELLAIGGPEVKLHDRRIYRRDHDFDENIYHELELFQKEVLGVSEAPVFKWHGLMGYTKSGIRIVGQDKRFLDLYYNLGCNGIGILPSIAGAKRIAQLIQGKKFEPSIFDPK